MYSLPWTAPVLASQPGRTGNHGGQEARAVQEQTQDGQVGWVMEVMLAIPVLQEEVSSTDFQPALSWIPLHDQKRPPNSMQCTFLLRLPEGVPVSSPKISKQENSYPTLDWVSTLGQINCGQTGRPLFFMIPEDQSHSHLSKVGIEQARCTIPMPHGEWLQNALGILQASTLEASKRCAREKGVTI
ncbi:Adenomatous Polyposis Coli Protein [Manis pentadactyla]|nr:Adenomatous Polyposis Coli Protein [Manis pentadactyla]